jgi:hypothetical protein
MSTKYLRYSKISDAKFRLILRFLASILRLKKRYLFFDNKIKINYMENILNNHKFIALKRPNKIILILIAMNTFLAVNNSWLTKGFSDTMFWIIKYHWCVHMHLFHLYFEQILSLKISKKYND